MTSPLVRVGAKSGALTTNQSLSPFDTGVGRQQCTFRFDLVKASSGQVLRRLYPYADQPPVLTHDSTRTVKRQLSLMLSPADTAAVDPIQHRVVPYLVLPTGAAYQLGRYMFSDYSRVLTTAGYLGAPALMDESFILDQARESAFPALGAASGPVSVGTLIAMVMEQFATVSYRAEAAAFTTASTWSFGTTNFQILSDLGTLGAYFAPWMDNTGTLRFVRAFDPAAAVPDVDWDRYSHVMANGITVTDDLLVAPNRFVVVSNSPASTNTQGVPIVGVYDIPASAPNSIQNRGFTIPDIRQLQITSSDQAAAVARAVGVSSTVFERVNLTTFPDPRHDGYTVVRWQGANWLELSWSMTLVAGGAMTHVLRKAYA